MYFSRAAHRKVGGNGEVTRIRRCSSTGLRANRSINYNINTMIRTSLIIVLTTLSLFGFGQNLEIININDNPNKAINPVAFENINKGFNLKSEDYIATINGFVVNSKESVFILFYRFWQKANELGAN